MLKSDVLAYAATVNGSAIAVDGSAIAVNGSAEVAGHRRGALFPSGSSSGSSSDISLAPPPLLRPPVVGSGDERRGATAAAAAMTPGLKDSVAEVDEKGGAVKASTVRRRESRESVSVPIRGESGGLTTESKARGGGVLKRTV